MSYDLYVFLKHAGQDPRATIDQILQQQEDETNESNQDSSSQFKIAVENIKVNVSFLEATGTDQFINEDMGLVIDCYPNYFSINLSYWHSADEAKEVFHKLDDVIKQINVNNNFAIYDPQDDEIKESIVSSNEIENYSKITQITKSTIPHKSLNQNKKPWWKFW